jgi:hypothetical protein
MNLLEQEKVFHLEVLLPIPILNFALGGGWGSPIMMMTPTPSPTSPAASPSTNLQSN